MSPEKEESKRRGRVLSSHWVRVHKSITEERVEDQGVLVILPHRWDLSMLVAESGLDHRLLHPLPELLPGSSYKR